MVVGFLVALVLLAGCGRRISTVKLHYQNGEAIREWKRVSIEESDPDQHWLAFTAYDGTRFSITGTIVVQRSASQAPPAALPKTCLPPPGRR